MKKKILIVGGRGSLAEALVRELSPDYEIVAVDREILDITDSNSVDQYLSEQMPDILINCAAYNAVDACEESEEEFEKAKQINGTAPGEMARICREKSILFIHYSTDYVFDGESDSGYTEDSIPSPINNYGKSKLLGEQLVQKYSDDYYILRVSWLFGKQGTGAHTKKSFVDIVLDLAEKMDELKLVSDELSSPTYTADIASQTRYIIEHLPEPGIYHVTNAGVCSWYDYGKEVLRIKGIEKVIHPVPSSTFPRPAKRPHRTGLINTKLPEMRSWQEAVKDYLLSK